MFTRFFVLLCCLTLFCGPAHATLRSQTGTVDTWVPGAHGNAGNIELGPGRQGLIKFTGSPPNLPSGSKVLSAQFTLVVSVSGATTIQVRPILQPWGSNQSQPVAVGGTIQSFGMTGGTRTIQVGPAWPNANGYALVAAGGANTAFQSNETFRYSLTVIYSPPGDANENGQFNQLDIVQLLSANRYLKGVPSSRAQGDFNGDNQFNQLDIILMLVGNEYMGAPFNAFGQTWR